MYLDIELVITHIIIGVLTRVFSCHTCVSLLGEPFIQRVLGARVARFGKMCANGKRLGNHHDLKSLIASNVQRKAQQMLCL